jgi:hypothetical protein
VLGAVYCFLMNRKDGRTVEPPLSFKDYQQFLLHYYERCFLEDPKSAWADSRYSAGWDVVNWFGIVWRDENAPPSAVADIKGLLAKLYSNGDEALRTCVETATLEHLFEQKEIRKYFEDWRVDSTLAPAYSRAVEWHTKGGRTPLGKRKGKVRGEIGQEGNRRSAAFLSVNKPAAASLCSRIGMRSWPQKGSLSKTKIGTPKM